MAIKGTIEILETQKSIETKSSIVPQVKDVNHCLLSKIFLLAFLFSVTYVYA